MSTFLLVVILTGRGVGGVLRARRAAAEDETVGVLLGVHRLIIAMITCAFYGLIAYGWRDDKRSDEYLPTASYR